MFCRISTEPIHKKRLLVSSLVPSWHWVPSESKTRKKEKQCHLRRSVIFPWWKVIHVASYMILFFYDGCSLHRRTSNNVVPIGNILNHMSFMCSNSVVFLFVHIFIAHHPSSKIFALPWAKSFFQELIPVWKSFVILGSKEFTTVVSMVKTAEKLKKNIHI